MGYVVHDLCYLQIVLSVLLVGLTGGQVLGLAGVVLAPLAQALDDLLHGGVIVAAAHAQHAVAAGLAHGLCHPLVAELEDAVEAVLQRHVVVHDLAALGDGKGVEHDQYAVHDVLELLIVRQGLGILGGDVLHGDAVPVLRHLHQDGDVLFPHAELLGDGDYLAIALCDVSAASSDHGDGVGLVLGGGVHLRHQGLGQGVEKAGADPGKGEGSAQVFGLVHDQLFIWQDGGSAVRQGGRHGLGTAHFQQIAVVFPPHTVVPVSALHVGGDLKQIIDVHDPLEALGGGRDLLLLDFLKLFLRDAACRKDLLQFQFVGYQNASPTFSAFNVNSL